MTNEGFIGLSSGHSIWRRTVGGGPGAPLLLLHGGPGAAHDYLEPMESLGADRQVIFYDQLGCGRSDKPDDTSLWTIDRFAAEIDEVRDALGLNECHILGQSWGGWLAIEYLLGAPAGVKSVVLASTSSSLRQFADEARRLIGELPAESRDALIELGDAGAYDDPAYAAAEEAFYRRHLCRLEQWPDCMMRTIANLDGNQVYRTMNGPNEFTITGNLKDWDRTDRLHEITIPALVTVGRYDEITPNCAETMRARLPDARVELFEHSAHTAHIEEPERYRDVVSAFLALHD